MTGYTKDFLEDKTFIEAGVEVTGKVYKVTFYLPGEIIDWDQKYFVKDGDDIDTVLSQAYYEKRLSVLNTEVPVENKVFTVETPLPFKNFAKKEEFKDASDDHLQLLKTDKFVQKGAIDPLTGVAGK